MTTETDPDVEIRRVVSYRYTRCSKSHPTFDYTVYVQYNSPDWRQCPAPLCKHSPEESCDCIGILETHYMRVITPLCSQSVIVRYKWVTVLSKSQLVPDLEFNSAGVYFVPEDIAGPNECNKRMWPIEDCHMVCP